MSHAHTVGYDAPLSERPAGHTLRRCDDCAMLTWVRNVDSDALWVVCGECVRTAVAEQRFVESMGPHP